VVYWPLVNIAVEVVFNRKVSHCRFGGREVWNWETGKSLISIPPEQAFYFKIYRQVSHYCRASERVGYSIIPHPAILALLER